jgi:uncharacterized coiled-coil protein SlyX
MAENTPDQNKTPEVQKDKPRPFTIFRIESDKTAAVLKETQAERAAVDGKLGAATKDYTTTLDTLSKELAAAGEKRLEVRKATVEELSTEVKGTQNTISELQAKLAAEQEKLARSQKSLYGAAAELHTEQKTIASENRQATNAKAKELNAGIKEIKKERNEVYKTTGKARRREKWNTFKRTTHEAAAYGPDLAVRFAKAVKRGTGEVLHVFKRSAQKANEGFKEPTPFSIKRDEPVTKQAQKKPDAPKA